MKSMKVVEAFGFVAERSMVVVLSITVGRHTFHVKETRRDGREHYTLLSNGQRLSLIRRVNLGRVDERLEFEITKRPISPEMEGVVVGLIADRAASQR